MPWCEPCERFFNPNSLTQAGACPSCGIELGQVAAESKLAAPAGAGESGSAPAGAGESGSAPTEAAVSRSAPAETAESRSAKTKAPWHFKLLVVATAGYVGWRVVQLIVRGLEALF